MLLVTTRPLIFFYKGLERLQVIFMLRHEVLRLPHRLETFLRVHAVNSIREKLCDGNHFNLTALLAGLLLRNTIRHHHLDQCIALGETLTCRVGEDAVRRIGVHFLRTVLLEYLCRLAQRAGRVDHVIHNDADTLIHLADQLHRLDLVGHDAAFQNGHDATRANTVTHAACPVHRSSVRCHNHQVARREFLLFDVLGKLGAGAEVCHWAPMEKALNLAAVQIHRHDAVDAHLCHHPCHGGRTDGNAARVLAVLASVTVVRDHGNHAACRGQLQCVNNQKQFHHRLIHVRAGAVATGWLNDKDVIAADRLEDLYNCLPVGKATDTAGGDGDVQIAAHVLGELRVCVAVHYAEGAVAAVARFHGERRAAGTQEKEMHRRS
ncbi:phosphoribosylpyrophosphate synthetase, putative [Leishmania tarentolae]|uniref:Phosphoribosylpyrophosphate synthetase, putative n=1 Tax=Leishmania tarentolae TaxID=5689 RepID=A0A640KVN9_LEITA|nr:phosphoribosylpyrophosphate synthetase, putative [Leishmania tarentolae]